MKRIVLAVLLALLAINSAAAQPEKVYRIGALVPGMEGMRNIAVPELARLGFVEGRNLKVDIVPAAVRQMPQRARELAALKPDVIVAVGTEAIEAAMAATTSIPIVMFGADAIVRDRAVPLSRPGGNATGFVILGGDLDIKRLELLHEAVSGASPIANLMQASDPSLSRRRQDLQAAAAMMGIELLAIEVGAAGAYAEAFMAMRAAGARAVAFSSNPQFYRDAGQLAALALGARLPTICQWREMAERGCLLSYGPSQSGLFQQAAQIAARILKGTAPADLPIEQPTKFELVINLKTAKALGLTILPTILARADEVIE